jgi:hypothetical protein
MSDNIFSILYISFLLTVIYIRHKSLELTQFTLPKNVNANFLVLFKSLSTPSLHQATLSDSIKDGKIDWTHSTYAK